MFQKAIIFAVIFLAVVFQVSFFSALAPSAVVPDVVLILITFWSAKSDFGSAWRRAALAGLLLDLFYFLPIGTNVVILVGVVFLTSFLAKRFLVTPAAMRFFVLGGLVAIMTIVDSWALVMIARFFNIGNVHWLVSLLLRKEIILSVVYNLGAFFVLYWPLLKLERLLGRHQEEIKVAR